MRTHGIDHVNILTDDLDATVGFYSALLGLARGESPAAAVGMSGAWMRDAEGRAIVHVVLRDPASDYSRGHVPGAPTGAVHHVAFRCEGFAAARERVAALQLDHRINDGRLGLRQIVVSDPNGIRVELNFPED